MVGTRDKMKSENQGCNKGSVGQGESLDIEMYCTDQSREKL